MGLPKGSKLNTYYFFTVENDKPFKMLMSFKCTPYNLRDNIISAAKKAALYNDLSDWRCDWRCPLVVTDLLKRPVVGPFTDFYKFFNGDF